MKNVILLAISLVLFGCGGGDFTSAAFTALPDETGGSPAESGGAPGTGGKVASGGASSTGGVMATGGAPEVDSGGSPATGGAPSTGGAGAPVVDAGCTLVTHDNGLGGTWQDCVPLETYNADQALKACKASGAVRCVDYGTNPAQVCGAGVVAGFDANFKTIGRWTYTGVQAGFACVESSCGGAMCPAYNISPAWS